MDSLAGILVDGMARLVGKRATDVLDIADVEWIRSKNSENRLTQRMRKLIAERNEKPPVLQSGLHNEPAEEQPEQHGVDIDALSKECDEWQQLALDYDAENRELNVQLAELEANLAEATAKADALEHGLSNRNIPAAQPAFVLDAIPETLVDVLKVRKMVDDDKRRETARRLRAAAEQADPAVGVSELEIFCILDVDMGGERGFADMQDVLRLADLIDRPARQGSEKGDER